MRMQMISTFPNGKAQHFSWVADIGITEPKLTGRTGSDVEEGGLAPVNRLSGSAAESFGVNAANGHGPRTMGNIKPTGKLPLLHCDPITACYC